MPPTPEPGTGTRVVAGRYRLLTHLGTGGMGTVWRAEDELLGRPVAVKEIIPPPGVTAEESQNLRERTLREARTAARLSHPNVVAVYDVVEDGDRPWIVMELLQARSLRDIVQQDGPLPVPEAARIGLQVLAALRAAHRLGIVHRDVKPGNVLIGSDGRAVLADFGIARGLDSPTLTTTGILVGSPSYIAPERARGQRGGPASDLWSLGATLYAAVEGRPPYERDGALPTLTAVVTQAPDPPRRAGALWPVISGLLRHDEQQRPGPDAVESMLTTLTQADDPRATAPLPRPADGGRAGAGGGDRAGSGTLGRAERTLTFHPTAPLQVTPATGPPPAARADARPAMGSGAEPPAEPGAEQAAPPPAEAAGQAAGPPSQPTASQAPAAAARPAPAVPQPPAAGPAAPGPAAAPAAAEPGVAETVADAPEPAAGPAPGARPEPGVAQTVADVSGQAAPAAAEPGVAETVADAPEPAAGPTAKGAEPAADSPQRAAGQAPQVAGQAPHAIPLPADALAAGRPARRPAGPGPPVPTAPGTVPVTAQPPGQNRRRWLLAAAAVAAVATVLALTLPGLLTSPGAPHPRAGGTPAGRQPAASPPSSQPSGQPGAGTAAVPAGWHRYRDPTRFSIGVPDGWQVSHQGHLVYVRDPAGGRFLLIDQTTHPRPDPLADWRQQEANRAGSYPGYHRIRLQAVSYPQAGRAADWEFTYNASGGPTHVLNRNVLANPHQAYALYWSTPADRWTSSLSFFRVFAGTFRPAPA